MQRPKVPHAPQMTSEIKVEKLKGKKGNQSILDNQSELIPTISFSQNPKNQQQQVQPSNISNEQDLGKFQS